MHTLPITGSRAPFRGFKIVSTRLIQFFNGYRHNEMHLSSDVKISDPKAWQRLQNYSLEAMSISDTAAKLILKVLGPVRVSKSLSRGIVN